MKFLSVVCLSILFLAGCEQNPPKRLNSPPQGHSGNRSTLQAPFAAMTSNAAQADLAVADIHFVSTSPELNGTGTVQLDRLIVTLKTYGGALRYTTSEPDQGLVEARLNRLEEYLTDAGVDMNRVTVRRGMPAGSGMSASEAIQAQAAPTSAGGASGETPLAGPSGLVPGAGGSSK